MDVKDTKDICLELDAEVTKELYINHLLAEFVLPAIIYH
jgi:hypothetical protein